MVAGPDIMLTFAPGCASARAYRNPIGFPYNAKTMNFDFALLNVGFAQLDADCEYNNVCSYFLRILLVTEGSGHIICGNEHHEIRPGRMYLVPPLLTHSVQCTSPTSHYYLNFTDQSMHIYDHFHVYRYSLEVASTPGMEQIMRHIMEVAPDFRLHDLTPVTYDSPHQNMERIKSFRQLPAPGRMTINGLLQVLLSRFMDQHAPAASVQDIRISKALWGINRNLAKVPSLDEIAARACLNKNTFIRLFRLQTGFTPTDYIIRRRILRAQILFVSGNHSVKDVASQVGYDNISYFGRTFKRIVGISPQHFINQDR